MLSSTWRLLPELRARVDEQLAMVDLSVFDATAAPPRGGSSNRAREIRQWLDTTNAAQQYYVARWVVLDDLDLTRLDEEVAEHAVCTNKFCGFRFNDFQRALFILSQPPVQSQFGRSVY